MRQNLLHEYLFECADAARPDNKGVVMRPCYSETFHNAGRVLDEAHKVRQRLLIVIHNVDEDEDTYR